MRRQGTRVALQWATLLSGAAGAALASPASAHAQIAIVVNRTNPVSDLSLAELARLYKGRVTTFRAGPRVVLGGTRTARRTFYRTVLHLDEAAVSRMWIGIVFSGQDAVPPKEFAEPAAALQFVESTPGAICFIVLAAVDDRVKVLTVDGLDPRKPAYPIR